MASGAVRCWGWNASGQLGDGSTASRAVPGPVVGLLPGAMALTAGTSHACALLADGSVRCWGANSGGQLGDGTKTNSAVPIVVNGLSTGATAITAGGSHTCALLAGGGIECWGSNGSGQLGAGSTMAAASPIAVSTLGGKAVSVSAGDLHTCALLAGSIIKCWGRNVYGQLGDGTTIDRTSPVGVFGYGD
ncbi:MAG: RCC1 domain-containing protein [Myxococcota bacterium]